MLSRPKVRVRALGSDRMSPTMKAARGSSTGAGGLFAVAAVVFLDLSGAAGASSVVVP